MIPKIISFRKSMACRLHEFQTILLDTDSSCSKVNEVWASVLHDLCMLKTGWLALWIVSEENCIDYNLIHPTAVIVKVNQYNFEDMTTIVTVVAVQNDTSVPSHLHVPLIDLHPIKDQDFDPNDLKLIANWLDKCRYFFKYLWHPWDAKVNVKLSQWCNLHLESRLKIQCDVQNGLYDRRVARYYKSLIKESWRIENFLNEPYTEELTERQRITIMSHCIRRKIIKLELNFFEDSESREDLMALRLKKPRVGEKIARFVWNGGDVDSLITHLNLAKLHIDSDVSVKVSSSFQDALDCSDPGELIVLAPGSHVLRSLMGLQLGGIIRGLKEPGFTEIIADFSGLRKAILFDICGNFNFKNLTIKKEEGIAIQISEKCLKITNCHIIGHRHPGTRGIVVLPNATLIIENCKIEGFGIGIAALKGGKVSISNCLIRGCHGGIKLTEDSELCISNTEISNCSEYGIRLESYRNNESPVTGEIDLLRNYSGSCRTRFNIESVVLRDNIKCNVIIQKNLEVCNPFVFDPDLFSESNQDADDDLSD